MPQVVWKLLVLTLLIVVTAGDQGPNAAQLDPQAPSTTPAPPAAGPDAAEAPRPAPSPLLVEPETADELVDAIDLMLRLARPDLAAQYVQRLQALNLDDNALLALSDKYGPATFIKFANQAALQPEASRFLERMNTAFQRGGATDERIDALLADLTAGPRQRELAVMALRSAGAVVVPRMLKLLSQQPAEAQHTALLQTLSRLGEPAVPPLIGAIRVPNEEMRIAAIEALGWLKAADAAPHLWYPAFGPDQPPAVTVAAQQALARILNAKPEKVAQVSKPGVVGRLKELAAQHYANEYSWPIDDNGAVSLWRWNPEKETLTEWKVAPDAASLLVGTQFAQDAMQMSPEDEGLQASYLGLALASDAYHNGWGRPFPTGPGTAHDLALTAGADVVGETLDLALTRGNTPCALATLKVLGQIGARQQLTLGDSMRAPLRAALNYPDQRVQFEAATTILELDPDQRFRGSERVVAILARALADGQKPTALVVDANLDRANEMGALFTDLGYDARIASTGQGGFRIASETSGVQIVALQYNTVRWDLSQTIANLRADARTAHLPIAIYGPDSARKTVEINLENDALTTFVVETNNSSDLRLQIDPLLERIKSPPLTETERAAQRERAAYWFAHIADGQRTRFYDIRPAEEVLRAAVSDNTIFENVLLAMTSIATPSVQTRLHELAVSPRYDVPVRIAAARQLATHIQRHGLLISTEEVSELEVAWRAEQQPELATALASVVGSLKPNRARVGTRLKRFTPPSPLATPAPTESSQ